MAGIIDIAVLIVSTISAWTSKFLIVLNTTTGDFINQYLGTFASVVGQIVLPDFVTNAPLYAVIFGSAVFVFVALSIISIVRRVLP